MAFLLFSSCLLLSLVFVGKASQIAIKQLTTIAQRLSWSTFTVSFLILGVATSIPEFLIGINSALDKNPQLSLGNLMGATIVLLTLIVGLSALLTGKVHIDSSFTKNDLFAANFILLFPLALFYDNYFGRADATLVLASYILYIAKIYKDKRKSKVYTPEPANKGKLLKHILILLGSILIVALSSKLAVESAIFIASKAKLSLLLVGILILSIGTNLPEISVSISAVRKGSISLVGGNVLGSASTNSLIIALLGLIHPIKIQETDVFLTSVFFFTISVVVFSYFLKSKSEISRLEGILLLSIYSFFLIMEIVAKLL
jgi:cation:H+ antiporter